VQEKVAGLSDNQEKSKKMDEDGLDDDYLMDNIMQGSSDQ
jgi:hypothetical protein